MKDCKRSNRQRLSSLAKIPNVMIIATLIAVGCGLVGATASGAAPVAKKADPPIVAKCRADLAKRFKLQPQGIDVIEVQATTWPDAALGMPEIDKMYAQVMTPGFRIILNARGSRHLYTASTKAYRYGGPIGIWYSSMLYIKPVQDEPNLNGDLYQCSLLGTNSVRLVSGVTDYYPQEKGMVIVKRRTSRSSHDLLYVKADGAGKAKTLHSSFDFGDATIKSTGDEWAGLVRPMVGAGWRIDIGRIGQKSADEQALPLPEGVSPGQIAWSGEKLMILAKEGERMRAFEISPKATTPEWKEVGAYLFPGLPDFMLNKSQTLEIDQVTDNGKSVVEVATVWFTGDRSVVARISDLSLRGSDLLAGQYAFIWGEKDSKPVAYTVDISTGEVIPSFHGAGREIKPFLYPPHSNPIVLGKSK